MPIFGNPTQEDIRRQAEEIARKQQELDQQKEKARQDIAAREKENAEHKRQIDEDKKKAGVQTGIFG